MQWDTTTPSAGFTASSVTPWMSVNPNYTTVNAASEIKDPSSPFNFWSSVLAARKKFKGVLVYGDFNLVDDEDENVVAYVRASDDGEQRMLIACNFSPRSIQWSGAADILNQGANEVVLSNAEKKLGDLGGVSIHLDPYEAFVVRL